METDAFIESYEAAPLTKKAYGQTLTMFDRFLNGAEATEEQVEEFLLKLHKDQLSAASINRHLSAIRAYFSWMKKRVAKEKRPDYDLIVRGPKVQRKLPPIRTGTDVESIMSKTENAFERALVMTLYDCALRIEELMNLRVEDLDFSNGYLKITGKGGEEYRLPISDPTLAALKEHIGKRKGQVFTEPYWRLRYEIRKLGNRAGIKKLTPHQLRHARATELRSLRTPIEDIQDFLRHKQIQTTLIYARMVPTEMKTKIPSGF